MLKVIYPFDSALVVAEAKMRRATVPNILSSAVRSTATRATFYLSPQV